MREVTGFERLRNDYPSCPEFRDLFASLSDNPLWGIDRFTLKDNPLSRKSDFHEGCLIWKLHAGGVGGHFRHDKNILFWEDRFYWLSLKREVLEPLSTIIFASWQNNASRIRGCRLCCQCHTHLEVAIGSYCAKRVGPIY